MIGRVRLMRSRRTARVGAMKAAACAFALLCLVRPAPALSQVASPGLERHTLEVGYLYKWYERDFGSTYLGQESWSDGAAYFRYGVCRWATISFEGGISNIDDDDYEGTDYRRYAFGGGLTGLVLSREPWRIEASGHYSEIFDHDRSANQLHRNVRDLMFVVQVERFLTVRDQSVVVWGGPAIVYDQSRQYPWGAHQPVKDATSNNFGFAVGVNAVALKRVHAFFQLVYADTFQPRVGAGVRF